LSGAFTLYDENGNVLDRPGESRLDDASLLNIGDLLIRNTIRWLKMYKKKIKPF